MYFQKISVNPIISKNYFCDVITLVLYADAMFYSLLAIIIPCKILTFFQVCEWHIAQLGILM